MFSLFISSCASARFSSLPLALSDVSGVELPLVDGAGVDMEEGSFDDLSEFFAAFSASRFCFEAEGAMMYM